MSDDSPVAIAAAASVDGSPPSSSLGVAVLRHGSHRITVDTSLLLSPHQGVHALTGMSNSRLQFEIDHWYQVIGDTMLTSTVRRNSCVLQEFCAQCARSLKQLLLSSSHSQQEPSHLYLRARVCRHLDESFDLELYEETIKLRRAMEAAPG
jgi:hypothetical protein